MKINMESATSFKLFAALWNRRQNMTTPHHHFRMAEWLERAYSPGAAARLLLMAFRSGGKSTLAGLFAAWLLYRDPNLRILVLAADHSLAKKMVRNVKRIIERHPLTAHLKPEKADQWAADRFTVKRALELRDPSMTAFGIASNITGSRADIVICDDVEVPNTCDTAEKRANLRARLAEIDYVLVPGGAQLYIGTPHSYYTIYADDPRGEAGEDTPFLNGFDRLSLPVLDEEGNSAWPERFTPEDLERIRFATGPNKFASQMMLRPVNIAEGRLDPDRLRVYDGTLAYVKELNRLEIAGRPMAAASAWWDPAFGGANRDNSVLACVFTDEEGGYWLHRMEYIKNTSLFTGKQPDDEASAQCRIVAAIAKDLRLPSVTVEINGIGKFLPAILRRELAKAKASASVQEASSRRPKDIRILEAFDAVMAARRLHVHASVLRTPFLTEMREWQPGRAGGHDDGLDAVAGALSLHPVRLPPVFRTGGHSWMKGAVVQQARTDFNV